MTALCLVCMCFSIIVLAKIFYALKAELALNTKLEVYKHENVTPCRTKGLFAQMHTMS